MRRYTQAASSPHTQGAAPMRFNGYDTGPWFDELFQDGSQPRAEARQLVETIESLEDGELERLQESAHAAMVNLGITFNVYSDGAGVERVLPFDIIPRVVHGVRVGPHRARAEAAHLRAQPLPRRRLPRREDPQRRRRPARAGHRRAVLPRAVRRPQPAARHLVPHHRHRPGARPRRRTSTSSKTTCAAPPASLTCWRTGG